MKNKIVQKVAILAILISTLACSQDKLFEQNTDFLSESWHKDSSLQFTVNIEDTINAYHVFFHTRISGQYNFNNLFLFIDTDLPNNMHTRDTLECILSEPSGKWLGKGFGDIWSYKIGYKKYIRFPYKGEYTFIIEQAMRTQDLKNVFDAGLSIEKAKK